MQYVCHDAVAHRPRFVITLNRPVLRPRIQVLAKLFIPFHHIISLHAVGTGAVVAAIASISLSILHFRSSFTHYSQSLMIRVLRLCVLWFYSLRIEVANLRSQFSVHYHLKIGNLLPTL